jgi:Na+/glutamate symporter
MDHKTMGGTRIRPGWIVAAGLAVLALVAFGVPLVSLLYVGILLLCPLLMVGMHGGHGQAHGHEAHPEEPDRVESSDPGGSGTRAASPSPEGGRT